MCRRKEKDCEECKPAKESRGKHHKKKEECCDCGAPAGHIYPHAAPYDVHLPQASPYASPYAPGTIITPGTGTPGVEKIGTPKEEGKPMPNKTSLVPAAPELAPPTSKIIET